MLLLHRASFEILLAFDTELRPGQRLETLRVDFVATAHAPPILASTDEAKVSAGLLASMRKAVLSQANNRTVVLDLARVDAIDAGGMGVLALLQGWARATEVDLKLMNPTSRVRELFELTNLDSVFEIFSSEDAVSSRPVAVAATQGAAAFQSEHQPD